SRRLSGISIEVPPEEQVALLLRIMPTLKRIGVLTQDRDLREQVATLRRACETHKMELEHIELSATSELPTKLDQLLRKVDIVWLVPDASILQVQLAQYIIGQCAARGVALLGPSATFVKAGATLSFERDYQEVGQRLARLCLRQPPRTGPESDWLVEAPQRLVVSINERSFKLLGPSTNITDPQVHVARY
ncbi:MAG: hypothetical protein HY000_01280, partial [Planctomycetes bacterium]|nr:hypothetical protein [Planctomycetota bacterium]